jgi:hypothetical protein
LHGTEKESGMTSFQKRKKCKGGSVGPQQPFPAALDAQVRVPKRLEEDKKKIEI